MSDTTLTDAEREALVAAAMEAVPNRSLVVPIVSDMEAVVERIVAARVAEARAEAWDKGFEAGWAAQDPDNHAPNPYREGADR